MSPFTQIFRALLTVLVLDGFTLALAMDVSPELHRKIHQDADDGDHDCLATQLHRGGFEAVLAAVSLPPVEPIWTAVAWTGKAIRVESFFLNCSIYEHGPPMMD